MLNILIDTNLQERNLRSLLRNAVCFFVTTYTTKVISLEGQMVLVILAVTYLE